MTETTTIENLDAGTYPLFALPAPGIGVRAYAAHCDRSRTADISAVAVAEHNAGRHVIVAANHRPDMVAAIGLGWRDERLDVCAPRSIVELTAAVYETWATSSAPLAVIVEDWIGIRTGPDQGHDDHDGATWVTAVHGGDTEQLYNLTGLDYHTYVRNNSAPNPTDATVHIGTRTRRGAHTHSTVGLMGGKELAPISDTVVLLDTNLGGAPKNRTIEGTVTVLAHYNGIYGHRVQLTRALDGPAHWQSR